MSQGNKRNKKGAGGQKAANPTKSKQQPQNVQEDVQQQRLVESDEAMLENIEQDKTIATLNKVMSEHSSTAQVLRQNINDRLESLERSLQNKNETESDQVSSLSATNQQVKQLLEKTIQDKLADLEEALRGKSVERDITKPDSGSLETLDKTASSKSDSDGKRTPKEKSPELQSLNKQTPPPLDTKTNADTATKSVESDTQSAAVQQSTSQSNSINSKKQANSKASLRKTGGQKDKSTVENVLKTLSSCETDTEKLVLLSKKYIDLLDENRSLEQQVKVQEKASSQVLKEREQLQSEHNRLVLAKNKLEGLCRELQRQNKVVKEDSLSKIKEEEEKRREIATKFQSTFNEIMQLVQENQKRNELLKDENQELAQKLKALMNHYDNWEKNIDKIIQQKDLESQLVKAKLAKTNLLLGAEKEQSLIEKKQLIEMVTELQKRTTELSQNEIHLRTELSMYTSKYEEFQSVLTKSNDTFGSFKKDMEKMSKQIRKLEKETLQWKNKWEVSNKALVLLTEEKQKRDAELLDALQKADKLDKLCRALQEERVKMLTTIKGAQSTASS